jgi:hypothetical protein
MSTFKLQIGSLFRLVLMGLGSCGVVISSQQSDSIIQAVGQIVSGLSILIPIVWAIVKNFRANKSKTLLT